MYNTCRNAEASRIDIAAHQAVSVQVAVGTRIQCVHGSVWVTQQDDSRDHCFAAGLTFCVDKPGQAVLTSLNGASTVLVRNPRSNAMDCIVPGTTSIHSLDALTGAARQARWDHVSRVFSRLMRFPLALIRGCRQRVCAPCTTARNP